MSRRASVIPYARALLDVAQATGAVESTGQELAALAAIVDGHAELQKVLTHPAVPPKSKHKVIDRLAQETGASAPLRKLLDLLADRDQLSLLPRLNEAYQERLMAYLGVVEAHVTTAVPLPPDKTAALAESFERAMGKRVRLTTDVDPSIMGGVVARLGSKVYDGSVTRHLERIRARLVAEGA